jgi:hypothetical protein
MLNRYLIVCTIYEADPLQKSALRKTQYDDAMDVDMSTDEPAPDLVDVVTPLSLTQTG